ncbi:cyclodeaminase/cyclohydrolase family protein [Pseudomonas sp. RIT-PI-S]|uniref:cyclodeaminase/cyclohydrolase family protein n=1 Tax=Pseudomonas sp. RIT-PI-S TaxID=3035295 RepID=UPI0021D91AB1|nr:cyclodeaminase/cyclohydrolase family protein [Pseudomonas sp. RIT-PI-S]
MAEAPDSSVWAWPLARFRDALAGLEPVPSCGATAAVCGDLGLALVSMALGKSQARQPSPERARLLTEAQELLPVLAAHADRDMRAFGRFIKDLPHTEPDDALRQHDVARMTEGARRAAEDAQQALELAVAALPVTDAGLRCDVLAGGQLIHASVQALLLNVAEDLPLLSDPAASATFEAARTALAQRAEAALKTLQAGLHR